ncbi:MAG TPA: PQQ-binding-like beta-propeller repeat protein, partial [Vulgatibacter sp.]
MRRLIPERFHRPARRAGDALPSLLAGSQPARALALLFACAAIACGDGSTDVRAPEPEKPAQEPSWEGVEVSARFASRSFGEVSQLGRGRFGPKKEAGLVVAGRSLLATGGGGETLWRAEWAPDEEDGAFMGGLTVGMRILDADGDGADDLLAVNDYGEIHLFDGASGASRWSLHSDPVAPLADTVIFGDDTAPLFLPAHSVSAHDVATGERRWTLPLPAQPVLATSARVTDSGSVLFAAVDRGDIGAADPDLFAVGADGKVLFQASTGSWALSLGAADLDGEGGDTLLAGTTSGALIALGSDGTIRFREDHLLGGESLPEFSFVERIAAQDLDGDGKEEILFTLRDYHRPQLTRLVAVDGSGEELWRLPLGDQASILLPWSGAERPVLLAALGVHAFGAPGQVAAIEVGVDGAHVLWTRSFPWFVTALDVAPDGRSVLAGAMDGRVRAFGLDDGAPLDGGTLGTFSTEAIAVSGDRIFVGDAAGAFSLTDADGNRLWTRTIVLDGIGVAVSAVSFGDAADPTLVAVGVSPYSGGDPGTIQAFTDSGETRYVVRTTLAPGDAAAARAAAGE